MKKKLVFMLKCTFFGNKHCDCSVLETLKSCIIEMIQQSYTEFYVGNQGEFDALVLNTLKTIKEEYPHISFCVVLAYLPRKNEVFDYETIYPEGLENTPPRFAINKRNLWLLNNSDAVIFHVVDTTGNSAKLKKLAEKRGKLVINI